VDVKSDITLTEEYILRMFENGTVLEPNRKEVKGYWRNLHDDLKLYSTSKITG
jgi:hypothetical protein